MEQMIGDRRAILLDFVCESADDLMHFGIQKKT